MDETADLNEPAWVLPGEPIPVRFMNTIWADRAGVHDALTTVEVLGDWLTSSYTTPHDTPPPSELVGARQLRDALRRLAALQTSDSRPAAASAVQSIDTAMEVVNAFAAELPAPHLARAVEGLELGPHDQSTHTALARLATEAVALLSQSPTPLRACQAPGCVLYFVRDHPRRAWCSAACGNRARVARHFARHNTSSQGDGAPNRLG